MIDEPLSALDPQHAAQAAQTLVAQARERGVGLLASLHHVEMALTYFPRIIGLRQGRIAFDLPATQVTPAMLEQLYAPTAGQGAGTEGAAESPPQGLGAALPLPAQMHCR